MSSLFDELKRRNVFKVAVAYGIVGWLIVQVITSISEPLALPPWVDTLFIVLILAGFPIALLFAWAFELTPDGVKMAKDVDVKDSITGATGQKINYIIIGALILLVGGMAVERFMLGGGEHHDEDDMPSIAVLAFENISDDQSQDYFADGISEEILNLLAKTEAMKVAGRTSSFSFKGKAADIPTIAEALNVNHVLEGSIRKSGNTLRITAQLIRDDGYHMWSETYDRELTDIFEIQDEISAAIMDELSVRLLGDAPKAATDQTSNFSAYDHYLRGIEFERSSNFERLFEARAEFEMALEIDPNFVKAEFMLLRAKDRLLNTGATFKNPTYPELLAEVDAFIAAHPKDPNPLVLKGRMMRAMTTFNMRASDEESVLSIFEQARDLGANSPLFYSNYGAALSRNGQEEEGFALMKRATEIDPLNGNTYFIYGGRLRDLERWGEAKEIYLKAVELVPDFGELWQGLGLVMAEENGHYAYRIPYDLKAVSVNQNDPEMIDIVVFRYLWMGELALAKKWSDRALELGPNHMRTVFAASAVDMAMGDYTSAIKHLEDALANPETSYRRFTEELTKDFLVNYKYYALPPEEYLEILLAEEPRIATIDDLDKLDDINAENIGFNPNFLLEAAVSYKKMGKDADVSRIMKGLHRATEEYLAEQSGGELNVFDYGLLSLKAYLEGNDEKAIDYAIKSIDADDSESYNPWRVGLGTVQNMMSLYGADKLKAHLNAIYERDQAIFYKALAEANLGVAP